MRQCGGQQTMRGQQIDVQKRAQGLLIETINRRTRDSTRIIHDYIKAAEPFQHRLYHAAIAAGVRQVRFYRQYTLGQIIRRGRQMGNGNGIFSTEHCRNRLPDTPRAARHKRYFSGGW